MWTPLHVHDTCTQPHTAPLHQTLVRTRLPGVNLWDLAQRLIRLSNDVHPNPGLSPPAPARPILPATQCRRTLPFTATLGAPPSRDYR